MYYSYVEIEYVATSFSPTRTDLALKLLRNQYISTRSHEMGKDRERDAHEESLDWRQWQIQQENLNEVLVFFMDCIELHKLTIFPADTAE